VLFSSCRRRAVQFSTSFRSEYKRRDPVPDIEAHFGAGSDISGDRIEHSNKERILSLDTVTATAAASTIVYPSNRDSPLFEQCPTSLGRSAATAAVPAMESVATLIGVIVTDWLGCSDMSRGRGPSHWRPRRHRPMG